MRKNNYNTITVIDSIQGDATVANLFEDKYTLLYNNVSSDDGSMAALHHRIRNDVAKQCSTVVDCSLHTYYSVLLLLTTDVIKAVKHLRNNKYNDDGVLVSNNFQNVTHLVYRSIAQLFPAMLGY